MYQYHQAANEALIRKFFTQQEWKAAFEALVQPLRESLWKNGNFEAFQQSISPIENLVLCLDYINTNLAQGGFIQLFQNGYAQLLVGAIQSAQQLEIQSNLWNCLDDALKVYVLNYETLGKETSVEEFANLYSEFQEFEVLETQYWAQEPVAIQAILHRILSEKP